MTTQFRSSGGSRQLLYPAPIHAGHQPANEPALHRHTDGSCGERESGPARSEGFGSGHADGGQGVTHLITDGWIPAHEVYSDEQDEMPRRLHDSDLRFESRFESGNLASAVRAGAGPEYNLYLRPDKGTGGCQWYYFMVSNMRRGLRYKLNIMHFYKEKSLYHHGQRPLFWSQKHSQSDESVGWRRAGDEIRYFENGIRKKNGRFKNADQSCKCRNHTIRQLAYRNRGGWHSRRLQNFSQHPNPGICAAWKEHILESR